MSGPEGRQQADRSLSRLYLVLAAVAVLGLGAVGYTLTAGSGVPTSTPIDVEGLENADSLVALARGVTKGDSSAQVTIVEFGDYQCPGCGSFARDFKPEIELRLIDSGLAKFVFHDFPLIRVHPNAFLAARAARCAEDQGRFWEYHDELFQRQALWSPLADPAAEFQEYAGLLGLDARDFSRCLNSDRHADVVTANLRLAESIGVPQTPTLLINVAGRGTRQPPGWDVESFIQTIEELSSEPPAN
jgi:protein-disulfide isomerase